jgi:hypothetical protein
MRASEYALYMAGLIASQIGTFHPGIFEKSQHLVSEFVEIKGNRAISKVSVDKDELKKTQPLINFEITTNPVSESVIKKRMIIQKGANGMLSPWFLSELAAFLRGLGWLVSNEQ